MHHSKTSNLNPSQNANYWIRHFKPHLVLGLPIVAFLPSLISGPNHGLDPTFVPVLATVLSNMKSYQFIQVTRDLKTQLNKFNEKKA